MVPDYATVLGAARAAAGAQLYPPATLYMVATPIGNLADITLRALHVLDFADAVACEDTRHTQALLRSYGIDKSGAQMLALHQHNEQEAAQAVIGRLRLGQRVAYASDAGTPAVSDPGARLVAAVRAAQLAVSPLPGASSVTALLSVAGIVGTGADDGAFLFQGFLSAKATERASQVQVLAAQARAVVLLEAPHRIEALARALAVLGDRAITVGRELTKQFEEIATLAAAQLSPWLAASPNRLRGEFVLVLHPQALVAADDRGQRLLQLLLPELALKTAVRIAADYTGTARNTLYETALAYKKMHADGPDGEEG